MSKRGWDNKLQVNPSVAQLVDAATHAGDLAGADAVGEAAGGARLVVRVGLWHSGGRVARARFRATTCASLIAFAEVACRLLEGGTAPSAVDADLLRGSVRGVHPSHLDRAALVAAAVPQTAAHHPAGGLP
jgi:NifU-like protein involved in Fe-S cluster formation